jgi:exoribonuclease-2
MLPEKLSTNLTSLNPMCNGLPWWLRCVLMPRESFESTTSTWPRCSIKVRLAYDAVSEWIENVGALPSEAACVKGMDAQLRVQDHLAQLLKKKKSSGFTQL